MKKNAMMKIAAILMVAVLLTTCAISSTFAKYVTEASDTAEARVAKWGVNVKTSLKGLFAETRTEGSTLVVKSVAADDDDVEDNVVAPGMSGSLTAARQISGVPEVAVEVTTQATVTLKGWTTGKCPLVFTVNGTPMSQGAEETVDAFAGRIAAAIGSATTQKFAAGQDLSAVDLDSTKDGNQNFDLSVSWTWAFEASGSKDAIDAQNAIDTAIGNLETAPEVKITLTTIVSQIETDIA